jgi:hypothetical protein
MGDSTSASMFRRVFLNLADGIADAPAMVAEERKRIASMLWDETSRLDFADYELECDDALITLGIARRVADPEYPDEMKTAYKGYGGKW